MKYQVFFYNNIFLDLSKYTVFVRSFSNIYRVLVICLLNSYLVWISKIYFGFTNDVIHLTLNIVCHFYTFFIGCRGWIYDTVYVIILLKFLYTT